MINMKINKKDLEYIKPSKIKYPYPFKKMCIDFFNIDILMLASPLISVNISIKNSNTSIFIGILDDNYLIGMISFIEKPDGSIILRDDEFTKKRQDDVMEIASKIMPLVHGIMNYIIEYQPADVAVAKKINRRNMSTNNKHKDYNHTIYLKRTSSQYNKSNFHINKPDHQVEVRGHLRHYKSGKTIWIKPYIRYKDENKKDNDKNFKLDFQ